jgi:hypothetical protein
VIEVIEMIEMIARRIGMTATALLVSLISLKNNECRAQIVAQDRPIAYFFDTAPEKLNTSTLSKTPHDVVVARVRIEDRLVYLVGRDQSGMPTALPPYLFYAKLKILEVRSGNAVAGATVNVTFAERNSSKLIFPHTQNQLNRDYEVVMYSTDDSERHLAGFPISAEQYQAWDTEVRRYDRSRSDPPKSR